MTTNPIPPPPPAAPADPEAGSPQAEALAYAAAFDGLMDGADYPLPAFPAAGEESEPDEVSVEPELAAMIRATMAGAAASMAMASRVAQAAEALERIADALEGTDRSGDPYDDRRTVRGALDSIADALGHDGAVESAISRVGR